MMVLVFIERNEDERSEARRSELNKGVVFEGGWMWAFDFLVPYTVLAGL